MNTRLTKKNKAIYVMEGVVKSEWGGGDYKSPIYLFVM